MSNWLFAHYRTSPFVLGKNITVVKGNIALCNFKQRGTLNIISSGVTCAVPKNIFCCTQKRKEKEMDKEQEWKGE